MNLAIAVIRYFNYLEDVPDREIIISDYYHQFLLLFTQIVALVIIFVIKW